MGSRIVVALALIARIALFSKSAAAAVDTTLGSTTQISPTGCMPLNNATGLTVNDLHFYGYQDDYPWVKVSGCRVTADVFNQAQVKLDTRVPNEQRPPPGFHGCDATLSGGTVPPGGTVNVCVTLYLNEQNKVNIQGLDWTVDGGSVGSTSPGGGFKVERPRHGGSGGPPQNQEGNGVVATDANPPNYQHIFCIENTANVSQQLTELKILASMTAYASPTAVNWAAIPAVQYDVDPGPGTTLQPPVSIAPRDHWCQVFDTTGSYLNGFIYLKYTLLPSATSLAALDAASPIQSFGEHPVEAYCNFPDCEQFPPAPRGCCQNATATHAVDNVTQSQCSTFLPSTYGDTPIWSANTLCPLPPTPSMPTAAVVWTFLLVLVTGSILLARKSATGRAA